MHLDDYIQFGFILLQKIYIKVPPRVICYKTLSNEAMCRSRSRQHLTTAHSALADNSKDFFLNKNSLIEKLDISRKFQQRYLNVDEASDEIFHVNVNNKKNSSIGSLL